MRTVKYLRDARHLEKGLYALTNELFYEPFEGHYEPSPEYLTLVRDLLKGMAAKWLIGRNGLWYHAHPVGHRLPMQGWKIHVSATIENGPSILGRAARIAGANGVSFKFALDRKVLAMMSSKSWHRGRSGKFITMYPEDLSCFKNLMEQLYAELREDHGPYILSDKRYKDCRVLYYRYGGVERNTELDITGEKILVMVSPSGETMRDVRSSYFNLPPWETDPFPTEKAPPRELTLNAGRYLVKKALGFSNSGGVYLVEDRHTGADVVVKEARAHTAMDGPGSDAIQRLKKEEQIFELLRDTHITPAPVESFQDWEHFFLAEEFVSGRDIRELMLTRSPLMRVNPTLKDTTEFYETFRTLFKNFVQALEILHQNGVVLGDLSASNIKIDPSTYAVRLIDFEGAFRPGVDVPTNLYTPGFRNPLHENKKIQNFEDDLYGMAAIMFYIMFPIPTLSAQRPDLFQTVLPIVLKDIGWEQTEVSSIISGLAKNEITCARVRELLDRPAQIQPPGYAADIESDSCNKLAQELGSFILANMRDTGKDGLFPADPFMYQTNFLSLGFGACGVLYALKKCGFEIPKRALEWLERELDNVHVHAQDNDLPPGLLTGASGIAWSLWELGLTDRAFAMMEIANRSPLLRSHHSYLYGMAGVGMTNLFLHLRSQQSSYLAIAKDLGDSLLEAAKENDRGVYWDTGQLIHLGYGYGQSGVALFLLRLAQISGEEKFLSPGRRALEFDLSHGVEAEPGVLSFPRSPADATLLPYLEEGSAGIARVAIRYGLWDRTEKILSDVHRKYAGFAGLLFGLGSFVDVLTDAYLFSKNAKFLEMAKRPASGIRDIYAIRQAQGSATPGEGLFRISCDYATGVAGVLRALHRFTDLDEADFTLDDAAAVAALPETASAVHMSSR